MAVAEAHVHKMRPYQHSSGWGTEVVIRFRPYGYPFLMYAMSRIRYPMADSYRNRSQQLEMFMERTKQW